MTDYLGKLIKRCQASATAIRPRPVARFEPAPPVVRSEPGLEELVGDIPENDTRRYRTPSAVDDSPTRDSNPFVKIEGIETIYAPPWRASLNDAGKTPAASAPADQRPSFEREPEAIEKADETYLEKQFSETVIQVRPTKIKLLPETRVSETLGHIEPGSIAQPREPDINVTIGRVEVRAVMPREQKPIARQKRTAPSLTLDDYLKKRGA